MTWQWFCDVAGSLALPSEITKLPLILYSSRLCSSAVAGCRQGAVPVLLLLQLAGRAVLCRGASSSPAVHENSRWRGGAPVAARRPPHPLPCAVRCRPSWMGTDVEAARARAHQIRTRATQARGLPCAPPSEERAPSRPPPPPLPGAAAATARRCLEFHHRRPEFGAGGRGSSGVCRGGGAQWRREIGAREAGGGARRRGSSSSSRAARHGPSSRLPRRRRPQQLAATARRGRPPASPR